MYNYCHRASESGTKHLPRVRGFTRKTMDQLCAHGCSGYSWKVNCVLSGPKAESVTYPCHVRTESSQKDTYWLEDQREQNWLIKTKEVITLVQILSSTIRQVHIPNCISIRYSHCYSLVEKSFFFLSSDIAIHNGSGKAKNVNSVPTPSALTPNVLGWAWSGKTD